MPISFRIDKRLGLLTTTGTGEVTDEEMKEYGERLRSDPDLAHVTREISDFRGAKVSVMPLRLAEIARMHTRAFSAGQRTRCAVLVSSELVYGFVRMYAVCAEPLGHEVHPFRSMAEAREWLGLEREDAP